MSLGQFTLAISSMSVVIDEFISYDRYEPEEDSGKVEYNPSGTDVVDGPFYEPHLIWAISALLTQAQWEALDRIKREQEYLRRSPPGTGFEIILQDEYRLFQERSPRTRANLGTVITVGSYVQYYAEFNVWLTSLKVQESGALYTASLGLNELGKRP